MNTKNSFHYDGQTFPKREINIPLKAVWEYLGYVEISLDCFDIALRYMQADFFMITAQIGNYAKEKIEDFVSNNGYQEQDRTTAPFDMFNNHIYYDANLLYQFSFEGEMEKYLQKDIEKVLIYDRVFKIDPKNIILNGYYRIDTYPHIIPQTKEKDFFKFITNKEVFQSLYECAEKDKKDIKDYSTILNSKLSLLNSKLNSFSEQLIANLTNQNLIQWYVILQKYVRNAMLLLADSSTNKIDTKQIVYIIKSLFEYSLDVDTKSRSFIDFTKSLVGTSYGTTEKYLRSPTMGDKDIPFTNNWIESLGLLDGLDTENPKVRDFIRFVLKEKYRMKQGLSIDQQTVINNLYEKYPS